MLCQAIRGNHNRIVWVAYRSERIIGSIFEVLCSRVTLLVIECVVNWRFCRFVMCRQWPILQSAGNVQPAHAVRMKNKWPGAAECLHPVTVLQIFLSIRRGSFLEVRSVEATRLPGETADDSVPRLKDWSLTQQGPQRRLDLAFSRPIRTGAQLSLEFIPRRPFGREVVLPIPSPEGVRTVDGLLAYRAEPSSTAVGARIGVTHQTVQRCLLRAARFGVMAALDDSPRPGKAPDITPEARAWLVSLACQKAKDLGYPHELWTTRLLARHAREHATAAGHPSLARIVQGTVCKILTAQEVRPHKVRYYLERRDEAFEAKMAEVLCVYREVAILKESDASASEVAIISWMNCLFASGSPNATRVLARRHIISSARSAPPIARMQ